MKKTRIPIIVLVLALGGVLWWWFSRSQPFWYAATIEATEITLQPRVAGSIERYHVQEGDTVQEGQTLLTLSADDLRLAADHAETEYQRGQQLFRAGTLTQSTLDQLTFQRNQTQLMVAWTTVTAPAPGVVLNTYHEPGELVRPGVNVLTLGDLSEVWATFYVPEPVLGTLTVGQSIQGKVAALPDRTFPGTVRVIRDQAEFTPKNVQTREERTRLVYGVKVVFANPDRILKPGMTIEADLPGTGTHP